MVAVNEALDGTPELVNSDPYGDGWLFEMVPADTAEVDALMDAEAYQASLEPDLTRSLALGSARPARRELCRSRLIGPGSLVGSCQQP